MSNDVTPLDHAVRIIYWVCCLAGAADLQDELQGEGIAAAIQHHDTVRISSGAPCERKRI